MRDEGNVPLELVQNAGMAAFKLLARYWVHVRPVFHRRSPLRGRLRNGRLTLADVFLCVLAAGFVLAMVLIGVMVFRVLAFMSRFLQVISRVMGVLSGI
ncbi:hypothetical protein SCUCBS95973_006721 [Sporothrix curviconia]|uniref:Uncharacterized protein n=1 Tax=Sporothrix curviconia TaxID=1260050 RepID=A0ABP0C9Z3_9PEZI